ncbi:hypothetical protein V8C42DRAFT_311651 [Trichoderma barbatum]
MSVVGLMVLLKLVEQAKTANVYCYSPLSAARCHVIVAITAILSATAGRREPFKSEAQQTPLVPLSPCHYRYWQGTCRELEYS